MRSAAGTCGLILIISGGTPHRLGGGNFVLAGHLVGPQYGRR